MSFVYTERESSTNKIVAYRSRDPDNYRTIQLKIVIQGEN